jgi:hypothetical protein
VKVPLPGDWGKRSFGIECTFPPLPRFAPAFARASAGRRSPTPPTEGRGDGLGGTRSWFAQYELNVQQAPEEGSMVFASNRAFNDACLTGLHAGSARLFFNLQEPSEDRGVGF